MNISKNIEKLEYIYFQNTVKLKQQPTINLWIKIWKNSFTLKKCKVENVWKDVENMLLIDDINLIKAAISAEILSEVLI